MGLELSSHLHPVGSFDLSDHPVPTGREEVWRFTPIKRLRGIEKDAPFADGAVKLEVEAAEGVTVETVPADSPLRGASGLVPTDRISARAWDAVTGATVIRIPAEATVPGATVVRHHGTGSETAGAGHGIIVAERFSKATVVLVFDGSAVVADNIEILVEDGAELTVVSLQDWADDAVHHSTQHARIGRDASLKHVAISFGGDLVRHDASVEYAGPGGAVEMLGLYFADEGQHLEHRLFVDHTAPRTRSHVLYKGALQGEGAHAVWIGNVLIRKVAEGIETYEENRNLVLSDGCQADSVPNLEIETGEIQGAGHASATARFDDEQLFYLRSRGVSEKEAHRLVVHGFFNDLIRKVGVPSIEDRLRETVEAELSKNLLREVGA
jgi:Fe-S cluster assembly protein SufD